MRMLLGLYATALLLMVEHAYALIPNCDFFDTANITTAQKLSNGSYLYENLVIPVHLTGEYDYKLLPDDSKEKVKSHLRGSVCKLKPCVRSCCPYNHIMVDRECLEGTEEDMDSLNPFLNLTLNNGSVVRRHFMNEFIVQLDLPMPCERKFYLNSGYEADKYTLFENGTFKRHYDSMFMNKSEYCMQHFKFKDTVQNTTFIQIAAHNCPIEQSKTGKTAQTVVICMLLTIVVCLFVKKLQNLHGKCFICYMFSIFMGYLLLLLNLWRLSDGFCLTSGYLGYFFVMAAFLWLSVISLRLWNTISGTSHTVNRNLPQSRFLSYNCYTWGMAAVLTGVTYLADKFVENEDWKPRVGQYEQCWIYTMEWSAMLYFYGPMLLLIVFNIIMFTLTDFANKPDRNQKLNLDKQTYTFFLRLFIIMGLNWSLKIISYLVQNTPWSKVLLDAEYINWSQGIIIFVLFIRSMRERIKGGSEESEAGDSEEKISLANTKFDPNVLQ